MEQVQANILPKWHSKKQYDVIFYEGSVALYAGKRWGKTLAAGVRLVKEGTKNPGLYWWVGLSWKSASMKRAWRTIRSWHRKIWMAKGLTVKEIRDRYVRENEKELYFPSGVDADGNIETKFVIWFRTADNPESIQGEGPMGIVVDEAAFMPASVWYDKIEPCTIDNAAWVILMSSSNDMCWFEDFWQQCKNGERSDWIAIEATTFENPLIMNNEKRKAKLDDIVKNTPPDVVDREYYCLRKSSISHAFDKDAVRDSKNIGVGEIPYDYQKFYVAFVDASGGGQNAYSLSIAYKELQLLENGEFQEIVVQVLKKATSFAHTKITTAQYAGYCKKYNIYQVVGDKYSGDWVSNEFLSNGIVYEKCDKNKSDLYKNAIPIINQRRVKYLDDGKTVGSTQTQLEAIESRPMGDHYKYTRPENVNDDSANVLVGNIYQLGQFEASIKNVDVKRLKNNLEEHYDDYMSSDSVNKVLQ